MTNDYSSLIQLNPVVAYAMHGFQRSSWCNMVTLMNASVKNYQISVFANTAQESMFIANQLKTYIESNPMINSGGVRDDISIGLRQPILDQQSLAYKTDMVMMAGMLQIINTKKYIHPCVHSVGGLDGTAFNIDEPWKKLCKMFKE